MSLTNLSKNSFFRDKSNTSICLHIFAARPQNFLNISQISRLAKKLAQQKGATTLSIMTFSITTQQMRLTCDTQHK
jgi:hypothetical protein